MSYQRNVDPCAYADRKSAVTTRAKVKPHMPTMAQSWAIARAKRMHIAQGYQNCAEVFPEWNGAFPLAARSCVSWARLHRVSEGDPIPAGVMWLLARECFRMSEYRVGVMIACSYDRSLRE